MIVYIAVPYSVWDKEKSFQVANEVAAHYMQQGHTVFSPISHSHPVQEYLPKETHTHDFWMKQDLPILELCDKLILVVIGKFDGVRINGGKLLRTSSGCKQEIMEATLNGIPIETHLYLS